MYLDFWSAVKKQSNCHIILEALDTLLELKANLALPNNHLFSLLQQ